MNKVKVDFSNDNNSFIINRSIISSIRLTEKTKCSFCPFYSGVQCRGQGDFWGTCSIYGYIIKDSCSFDDVVYDNTKCKVFEYLNKNCGK